MTNPANFTWFTLTTTPDTRPEDAIYAGRIVGVPPGTVIGSGIDNPGVLFGIYGYADHSDPNNPKWMMGQRFDADTIRFLRLLPRPEGWTLPTARNAYRTVGIALLDFGIGIPDTRTVLRQLHDHGVANERAWIASGVGGHTP